MSDAVEAVRIALAAHQVDLTRLRGALAAYDPRGLGYILSGDVAPAFAALGVKVSRPDVDGVTDRFTARGSRTHVLHHDLLAALAALDAYHPTPPVPLADLRVMSTISDDLADKMRHLVEALILQGRDYRAELDVFDSTFGGCLPHGTFRDVLQDRFRASLTTRELEVLERAYRDVGDPRKVGEGGWVGGWVRKRGCLREGMRGCERVREGVRGCERM